MLRFGFVGCWYRYSKVIASEDAMVLNARDGLPWARRQTANRHRYR
jgi:hypothetical protein